MEVTINRRFMKGAFMLLIISLFLFGCEEIITEKTINKRDYYVEYTKDNREIYRFNDNTKMNGVFKVIYENALKESFSTRDGQLFDAYKTYHPNSMVASETGYLRGLKNGAEKTFYPSGKLQTEKTFRNGKKIKVSKSYYENGAIQSKTDSEGNTKFFDKNGSVLSQSNTDHNKIFKDGKLRFEEYEYKDKIGPIMVMKSYQEDGSVSKILGMRMDNEMMSEENIFLLVLDENHAITDSINPKQDMAKFMKVLKELGPELANELPNW